MPLVVGDEALARFRRGLTGRAGLDVIRRHGGRVMGELPVGIGKSVWLDAITNQAVEDGDYELVIVVAPTRRLLEERGPRRSPPAGARVVTLRPRPASRCGPERDATWRRYESADLGALGRADICGHCPVAKSCFWPTQYGKFLKGAAIVYATQAHLERSPSFLRQLRGWAGARRVLTLVDECDLLGKNFSEQIRADDLDRCIDVFQEVSGSREGSGKLHGDWLSRAEMLRGASLHDLQDRGWKMPRVRPDWAAAVQRAGLRRYGEAFRFLGYRLVEFADSPIETRFRDGDGTIHFASRPYLGDCMVFTATTDLDFARYRFGANLVSPFEEYVFKQPGTRWLNIASRIGARAYFAQHAPQVLDFYAGLAARRTAEGRRVLLVAKKCFVDLCTAGLAVRFAALGADLEVVTGKWTEARLADPRVVPLISYGMIGTNLFEGFDCAYCLTGYYVDEGVVEACLQDIVRPDLRMPIRIETVGHPRRRRAGVADPAHRDYDVARLAQPALEFKEHGVVVQAVGRVRPFTRPREIVTFQMGQLPGVTYDAEFHTLNEARRFFEVASGRERRTAERATLVAALRAEGLSQAEVASRIGVTERTVRNYESKEDRKNSIYVI
jgi:hypothetical protein